jgi:hypothetical protein
VGTLPRGVCEICESELPVFPHGNGRAILVNVARKALHEGIHQLWRARTITDYAECLT